MFLLNCVCLDVSGSTTRVSRASKLASSYAVWSAWTLEMEAGSQDRRFIDICMLQFPHSVHDYTYLITLNMTLVVFGRETST